MILDEIVRNKRQEVKSRKRLVSTIKAEKSDRNFLKAITKNKINLIAEIKRKSPSRGNLIAERDVARIAKEYDKSKVAAISVVTEGKYFDGSLELLKKVRRLTKKPILCKDFIIDSYQISEARAFGADAILLIARILEKEEISKFIRIAKELGMDCLLEVHDKKELLKVPLNAEIIGINNRNLSNMRINLETTKKLSKLIKGKVVVGESGYYSKEEIIESGADAVLIGTSILKSGNVKEKINELV